LSLSILSGTVVGFSLGLTGGGGSIFAVPLLVYALAVEPRQAVGVSLAAVGATALAGSVQRLRAGEIEVGTGMIFALAGMAGAPVGAWIGRWIPPHVLLILFAGLMLVVAARMWRKASRRPQEAAAIRAVPGPNPAQEAGPSCQRDPEGKLRMTSRCALILGGTGWITGVLSGLFGVGGGFVIVPALVLFSGMGIHRAVATSLMVIVLVSASGVMSYLISGRTLPMTLTGLFVAGGVLGTYLGTWLGRRLPAARLQQVFAVAMVLVASYMIVKNVSRF
jgi:hypothetical protein